MCQLLSLTLCDHMDYSPPGSSVPRILQARILEWVTIPFSRGSPWTRDRTRVSSIAGRFFTIWATKKYMGYKSVQHIKKHRHYFANKVPSSQSYGLPVVMYGCESWTIKKPEHWRIDAFELWCWRRLLRVPWTAMRSNQSTLNDISPDSSLEGLMLKLKLQ